MSRKYIVRIVRDEIIVKIFKKQYINQTFFYKFWVDEFIHTDYVTLHYITLQIWNRFCCVYVSQSARKFNSNKKLRIALPSHLIHAFFNFRLYLISKIMPFSFYFCMSRP